MDYTGINISDWAYLIWLGGAYNMWFFALSNNLFVVGYEASDIIRILHGICYTFSGNTER